MHVEQWIQMLSKISTADEEAFLSLRDRIPLGANSDGGIVTAYTAPKKGRLRHLCVTGVARTEFLKGLIVGLSCLYQREEISFFILSPKFDYTQLLSLSSADITLPFVRTYEDCTSALETVKELVRMRQFSSARYPRLVLVLDGLEGIYPQKDDMLDAYKPFMEDLLAADVDMFTGADLLGTIFSGYPGAFVGVGNCLITADECENADVTYVGEDCSLSKPTSFSPSVSTSIDEAITLLNSLSEV